jgi:hypothetical protein
MGAGEIKQKVTPESESSGITFLHVSMVAAIAP